MTAGIQALLKAIGEDGCYALCIVELGQRGRPDRDCIDIIEQGKQLGILGDDMYVNDPPGLLTLARGGHWTVTKEAADYLPQPGELVVERWEYTAQNNITYGHFVLPDWDSLGSSNTRRLGHCVSKRIFREAI